MPGVRVVGAPRAPLRDTYHLFLRVPWSVALALLVGFYLILNACFATAFACLGGVTGVEAQVRVSLVRTERTKEGMTFYRLVDLTLTRDRSPAVARSWTVMHPITPNSPLFGKTPTLLASEEVELIVTLVGVDDTSLQPVHARKAYADTDVVWGGRHADILQEEPDGSIVLDVRKFHQLEKTAATPEFPYPEK